jgi:hypothetical protein
MECAPASSSALTFPVAQGIAKSWFAGKGLSRCFHTHPNSVTSISRPEIGFPNPFQLEPFFWVDFG